MKRIIYIAVAFLIAALLSGGYYFYKVKTKGTQPKMELSKDVTEGNIRGIGQEARKMGEFYFAQSRYRSVIATYQGMLAKDPNDIVLKRTLADTYAGLAAFEIRYGRKEEAKKSLDTAIKLDPENKKALELQKTINN